MGFIFTPVWSNLYFHDLFAKFTIFCVFLSKFVVFAIFWQNLRIFVQSFDENCIFSVIHWRNLHFFQFLWRNSHFSCDLFTKSTIFIRMNDEMDFFCNHLKKFGKYFNAQIFEFMTPFFFIFEMNVLIFCRIWNRITPVHNKFSERLKPRAGISFWH